MSSFRDLKNSSGRDLKIVRDFASSDICVSLGLSQTSYYVLTSFGKGMSLTLHLLPRALTVERICHLSTAFPSVARCMIIILQIRPFGTMLRHFQSGNTEHLAASSSCIVYNST